MVACSPEQAAALASFSPHHIGVATAFGASSGTGGVTLAMAVRGRRAVSRWRNAVGADVSPDVAKVTNPDCLRATLGAAVMTVSLSAATAKRELAFLFAGRVAPRQGGAGSQHQNPCS